MNARVGDGSRRVERLDEVVAHGCREEGERDADVEVVREERPVRENVPRAERRPPAMVMVSSRREMCGGVALVAKNKREGGGPGARRRVYGSRRRPFSA